MRMTDTLGLWNSFNGYTVALRRLCIATGTTEADWKILGDTHQVSTREAGKSSCVFFLGVYKTLEEAVNKLTHIHKAHPLVNVELQLMPDGQWDFGDGPGYYLSKYGDKGYLPLKGFAAAILVDAQNLQRGG